VTDVTASTARRSERGVALGGGIAQQDRADTKPKLAARQLAAGADRAVDSATPRTDGTGPSSWRVGRLRAGRHIDERMDAGANAPRPVPRRERRLGRRRGVGRVAPPK
jgi:hypothetical protein